MGGGDRTWRQNKIKYIKVGEDTKKILMVDRHTSMSQEWGQRQN